MTESLADMIFHRLDGNTHLGGNLLVRAAMKGLQHDNFFPYRGQGFNGGAHFVGNLEVRHRRRLDSIFFEDLTMTELQPVVSGFLFNMIDQQITGNDEDLFFKRIRFRKGLPELPQPDKALLGEVFGGIVKGNTLKKESKYLDVQGIIYIQKSSMIAFFNRDQFW